MGTFTKVNLFLLLSNNGIKSTVFLISFLKIFAIERAL